MTPPETPSYISQSGDMHGQRSKPDFSLCESPIEMALGEELWPKLHPDALFRIQKQVSDYRLDFAASFNNQHVAIECDGKPFHHFYKDRQRDIRILKEPNWRMMLRFRGGDITHSLESCIALTQAFAPHLFDPKTSIPSIKEMIELSDLMAHRFNRMVCRVPVSVRDISELLGLSDVHRHGVQWLEYTPDRRTVFVEFKTHGWVPEAGVAHAQLSEEQLQEEINRIVEWGKTMATASV